MVVRERASAVLSGAHAAFEAIFVGGEIKAHVFGLCGVKDRGAHTHRERARPARKEFQRDLRAWPAAR